MTEATLKKLFPNASPEFIARNIASVSKPISTPKTIKYEAGTERLLPDPIPKRHKKKPLGKTVPREAQGNERVIVSFTGYRVRPLDPDNHAASVKDLLDGLRHSGILLGDEPWKIILKTDQVRVGKFKDEKTVIEIEWP